LSIFLSIASSPDVCGRQYGIVSKDPQLDSARRGWMARIGPCASRAVRPGP